MIYQKENAIVRNSTRPNSGDHTPLSSLTQKSSPSKNNLFVFVEEIFFIIHFKNPNR